MLERHLWRRSLSKPASTRQAGFNALQHEQLVLNYLKAQETTRRREVIELCNLTPDQATVASAAAREE